MCASKMLSKDATMLSFYGLTGFTETLLWPLTLIFHNLYTHPTDHGWKEERRKYI